MSRDISAGGRKLSLTYTPGNGQYMELGTIGNQKVAMCSELWPTQPQNILLVLIHVPPCNRLAFAWTLAAGQHGTRLGWGIKVQAARAVITSNIFGAGIFKRSHTMTLTAENCQP